MSQRNYPRPLVTVDIVLFTIMENDLKVLLIRRRNDPFKNLWALPGGFVELHESLEDAAQRELQEETGITDVYLEQLYTFGDPDRDPRGRVISVAHFALTDWSKQNIIASSDASETRWHSAYHPPKLAFDHKDILKKAIERLRSKVSYTTIGFELLPEKFTLTELQHVYEVILQRPVDKRNFRKQVLAQGMVQELDELRGDGAHRPARLYRFKGPHN